MILQELELFILALLPAVASAAAFVMVKKTGFGKIPRAYQQVIIGVIFGIVGIIEALLGVNVDYYTISVKNAVPVCAGLIFGGPAGIIAGVICGLERIIHFMLSSGTNMLYVCSAIAVVLAGILAALVRKFMFGNRRATAMAGFCVAAIAEIMHLNIIMNIYDRNIIGSYDFIIDYSLSMVVCSGITGTLAIFAVRAVNHDRLFGEEGGETLTRKLRRAMLIMVFLIMLVSTVIALTTNVYTASINLDSPEVQKAIYRMSVANAYINLYMEFVALAILYAFMFVIMQKTVDHSINKMNDKLKRVIGSSLIEGSEDDYMDSFTSVEKNIEMFAEYVSEKIDEEMNLARQIQMSAMPQPFKTIPELVIQAKMEPAREVGGDFYDYFELDNNRVAVLVADVSGKGTGAAMFMMKAKGIIRKMAVEELEIDEIFNRANRVLCEGNGGAFVTVWMGIINLTTGHIDYADAGHGCPLMKIPGKGFEYVDCEPELVMAGYAGKKYKIQHLEMVPGSRLYLFTDGVTEANDENENLYGEDRLKNCLTDSCIGLKGSNLIDAVIDDMKAFTGEAEQFDDITMLVADYMGTMENGEKASQTFRASGEVLEEATDFICSMLAKVGCSSTNEMQVSVAFEEMFMNIANYGFPENEGYVTVEACVIPGVVQIVLMDGGIPFNPLEKETPDLTLPAKERAIGGLGIVMTLDSMDYVHYEFRDDMNILTMKKILD